MFTFKDFNGHFLHTKKKSVFVIAIAAWPVSIVLKGKVHLIDNPEPLRPGLGSRGAFGNSGSRDAGPDPDNVAKRLH